MISAYSRMLYRMFINLRSSYDLIIKPSYEHNVNELYNVRRSITNYKYTDKNA